MDSTGDFNPYAPPLAESQPVSDAEREIRVVIRVFRLIGWSGAIFYIPAVVGPVVLIVRSVFVPTTELSGILFIALAVNSSVAALFCAYIYVASSMASYTLRARRKALLLCGVMLIGFPLFTIVGVVCIRKVRRYYGAYCTEHLSRQCD